MDDSKRETNKTKRSKSDYVKNTVITYLQKRNYATIGKYESITSDFQKTHFLVETEISKPNSILYSCYNTDPIVIDHSFTKFLAWIKDLAKNKNICHDIEYLIGPLFCHLYLDILKSGHGERAITFFKAHLPTIDKSKCDDFVKDLINLLANDSDATCLKEQYRANKYYLELSPHSILLLKKFVAEHCHVVFLHILQAWFDIHEADESNLLEEKNDSIMISNGNCHNDVQYASMMNAIQELENEPQQVFVLKISNVKNIINCGLINPLCKIVAYDQTSVIHLRPINSYDSILNCGDCKEIQLKTTHSKQIFAVTISPDNKFLITAAADGLNIYNLDEMELSNVCTGHLGPIYCTTVSSNNTYVASGSHDTTARLWDIESGQNLRIFTGHNQAITSIDFHPNCLYLATGSADHNIRLWSLDNGNPLRLFHGCKGIVYAIAFSPLGESLASASDDRRIRIWDVLSSKISFEIKYKSEPITKLVWSADGKKLCTGSTDGVVRVWDLTDINQNSADSKYQEPIINFNVNGKILHLDHSFDTFACLAT